MLVGLAKRKVPNSSEDTDAPMGMVLGAAGAGLGAIALAVALLKKS